VTKTEGWLKVQLAWHIQEGRLQSCSEEQRHKVLELSLYRMPE
jgi:hypothetical protein